MFLGKFFCGPHVHQLDVGIRDGRLEIIRSYGLELRTAAAQRSRHGHDRYKDSFHFSISFLQI